MLLTLGANESQDCESQMLTRAALENVSNCLSGNVMANLNASENDFTRLFVSESKEHGKKILCYICRLMPNSHQEAETSVCRNMSGPWQ